MITKGGIGGFPDVGGGVWNNELPDALTWLIRELRLRTKDWSTTDFPSMSSLSSTGGMPKPLHPSKKIIY